MKPAAAAFDHEVNWYLHWQPEGQCNSFTRETILASAPATSGVYGLFNFDCQLFIGESANIQDALLRHESETDFHSRHLRPTGFTFEPCDAESRDSKAAELIEKFHPILQTGAALTETWSAKNDATASPAGEDGDEPAPLTAASQEFSAEEREERPQARRRFQLKAMLVVVLVAMALATAATKFYLGVPTDHALNRVVNGANSAADKEKVDVTAPSASSTDKVATLAKQKIAPAPAKPAVRVAAPAPASPPSAERSGASEPPSAALSKKWSVQVSAVPAKDTADQMIEQLKAKGYDGYMARVEVKGQTYYRVRVGHFDSREKADSVRQALVSQASYRGAFLAGE